MTAIHPSQARMLSLPGALFAIGMTGAAIGIGGVGTSSFVYMQSHDFSFFTTYLSDVGDTAKWPMVLFNTAMLMVAPVRYLFLVLLVMILADRGTTRGFNATVLVLGAVVVLGTIGMSAFPASLDLTIHKTSAMVYFFGVVILQILIGLQEWRLRLPLALPVTSFAVVAVYLVFAVLLVSVERIPGVTRDTPVIWEWMAFLSLMIWLITHSFVLGRSRR